MRTRRLCAAALGGTAAIHLAVVPRHQREWPAAAVFFVLLAAVEALLAVAVLAARPARRVLLVGAVLSAASAGLWAVSRTVGLPFGPEAFAAEPGALVDVIASVLEAATAAAFVQLAVRAPTPARPIATTT